MCHVRLNKMPGGKCGVQTQLARQHSCGNDSCQLPCVISGGLDIRTAHTKEVEHGGLGFQDGPTTYCTNFDAGHADGNLEVPTHAARQY